eukprot:NODE_891_length_1323_cov_273.621451.p1 GENE.NODE_891_length_1323_cov_273.621451~~NODE_891_length_1323_cov_273.621451.p1  ORF type:complete len:341 (-),score=90.52 NODE_891_length_1323_cov_273.621451:159-1181(-)
MTPRVVDNYTDFPKFENGDKASPVPDDSFFSLEATTIDTPISDAAALGNRVITGLGAEEGVLINKVSRTKMSIKAEAWRPMPCSFKVRIYVRGDGRHAVEFQRRSGDHMAFMQIYSHIEDLLDARPMLDRRSSDGLPQPDLFGTPHFVPKQQVDSSSVQVLLDMATQPDRHLQAEAAGGLANAVAVACFTAELCTPEACFAAEFCTPEAFASYLCVLRNGGYAALSAMAQVLSVLAMTPQAAACFAHTGFWQGLLDTLIAHGMCEKLKRQLAQVACCALTLGAMEVAHDAAEQQLQMLLETMKHEAISPLVRNTLSEATALLPDVPKAAHRRGGGVDVAL